MSILKRIPVRPVEPIIKADTPVNWPDVAKIVDKYCKNYYSPKDLLELDCQYNLVIGERGPGKTTALLITSLVLFMKYGVRTTYVRRLGEELKNSSKIYDTLVSSGIVERIAKELKQPWKEVKYKSGSFYLAYREMLENHECDTSFCEVFSINQSNQYKSSGKGVGVRLCIFEEFMHRGRYLHDEFPQFLDLLSTTTLRDGKMGDAKIFMLSNTTDEDCPYFNDFGVDMSKLEKGKISLFDNAPDDEKDLCRIGIEWTNSAANELAKVNGKFYCFMNNKLEMITKGEWQQGDYPKMPIDCTLEDIIYRFYIKYNKKTIQGDIIEKDDMRFIFLHYNTTYMREGYPVYSLEFNPNSNYYVNPLVDYDNRTSRIAELIRKDKVFVQDNRVGEMLRRYCMDANSFGILNL